MFGFEKHTIRGITKMMFRVTLAYVLMLAFAVAMVRAGKRDKIRSFCPRPDKSATAEKALFLSSLTRRFTRPCHTSSCAAHRATLLLGKTASYGWRSKTV